MATVLSLFTPDNADLAHGLSRHDGGRVVALMTLCALNTQKGQKSDPALLDDLRHSLDALIDHPDFKQHSLLMKAPLLAGAPEAMDILWTRWQADQNQKRAWKIPGELSLHTQESLETLLINTAKPLLSETQSQDIYNTLLNTLSVAHVVKRMVPDLLFRLSAAFGRTPPLPYRHTLLDTVVSHLTDLPSDGSASHAWSHQGHVNVRPRLAALLGNLLSEKADHKSHTKGLVAVCLWILNELKHGASVTEREGFWGRLAEPQKNLLLLFWPDCPESDWGTRWGRFAFPQTPNGHNRLSLLALRETIQSQPEKALSHLLNTKRTAPKTDNLSPVARALERWAT